RSRFEPCMIAAVMPSMIEKMTSTVRSSRSVMPDRREAGASIAGTNVVPGARLPVLAHAAELELVGIGERLRRRVLLGGDRELVAFLEEAVGLHRRLRLREILVVHVDQHEAELVGPFAQLVVAEIPAR